MGKKKQRKLSRSDVFELLFYWIPELVIFPLRVILGLLRKIGRLIGSFFDGI